MSTQPKNQPSKAEWDEIEKKLDRQLVQVYLRCDGYLIAAGMVRVGQSLRIVVYVDGWVRGKWMGLFDTIDEMPDEARKFYRHRSRQRIRAKELKAWEKILGKRECKRRKMYDKIYITTPEWLRPRPLINQLKVQCDSIQILTYEQYKPAVEAMKDDENPTT